MFVFDLLKKYFPQLNKRIYTEEDVIKFCRANKVYIVDDKRMRFGRFIVYKGYNFILINPKLESSMRLWVLWHEVAHFLLHAPETANFSESIVRRKDREANYCAALLMIPKPVCDNQTMQQIHAEYNYPKSLVEIRKVICDNEGK